MMMTMEQLRGKGHKQYWGRSWVYGEFQKMNTVFSLIEAPGGLARLWGGYNRKKHKKTQKWPYLSQNGPIFIP